MTEAFKANDYRKIRLLGACSLLFSSPGSFTTAMLVALSAKILKDVCLLKEASSFPIQSDLCLNIQFKQ
jgi:hypothetical protein